SKRCNTWAQCRGIGQLHCAARPQHLRWTGRVVLVQELSGTLVRRWRSSRRNLSERRSTRRNCEVSISGCSQSGELPKHRKSPIRWPEGLAVVQRLLWFLVRRTGQEFERSKRCWAWLVSANQKRARARPGFCRESPRRLHAALRADRYRK